jgi:peptidyl-prolyl cis-trans isomerase C
VQTQFGWHVIILDDTRESTPPPFDDVKERLKLLLANQKLQQHIETAKAAASIEIR